MSEFWNQKYGTPDYLYGVDPNAFIKEQLQDLQPGNILFPAEGEGRNAVYAAQLGWNVLAFDTSNEARKKALKLADSKNISLDFRLLDYQMAAFEPETFDAIGLVFTHLLPPLRSTMHQKYLEWLKPGGTILLEAFTPEQLNYSSGGPKALEMLFTREQLKADFKGAKSIRIEEKIITLDEGPGHQGPASVIRCVVKK
ncbi:MAG: SAM-dependent methyltransferase [Bacteroidetes bacterium HGW-Bacteroidetes-4]|jgi:SAM-dependent methyltransferase|nr:MAG: SAM-dependent methyltransferase [Bacteroidetes bacterium HGW-Bacteroidetes-4]